MTWEDNDEEFNEPQSMTTAIFLSETPVDVIKQMISTQFDSPADDMQDYVSTFIDNYRLSCQKYDGLDEETSAINEIKNDFFTFLIDLFGDKLQIGFPDFDDAESDEQCIIITLAYQFFIINIKRNYTKYIMNYIKNHEQDIADMCSKKKDITTLAYKKDITGNDLVILADLPIVAKHIISLDADVETFILLSDTNHHAWENADLLAAYEDCKITGNFIDKYRDMITTSLLDDIVQKIRNKIIKNSKK